MCRINVLIELRVYVYMPVATSSRANGRGHSPASHPTDATPQHTSIYCSYRIQYISTCVCVSSIMAMHPKGMGRYKAPAKYILLCHTFSKYISTYVCMYVCKFYYGHAPCG
jgi:hypothetical protein